MAAWAYAASAPGRSPWRRSKSPGPHADNANWQGWARFPGAPATPGRARHHAPWRRRSRHSAGSRVPACAAARRHTADGFAANPFPLPWPPWRAGRQWRPATGTARARARPAPVPARPAPRQSRPPATGGGPALPGSASDRPATAGPGRATPAAASGPIAPVLPPGPAAGCRAAAPGAALPRTGRRAARHCRRWRNSLR